MRTRGMPRHPPAKKDAGSGETLGRGAPSIDPEASEWGNPPGTRPGSAATRRLTRGIETSKYPEEKKSTEIPPVAASEAGRAQTAATRGRPERPFPPRRRSALERAASAGESPLGAGRERFRFKSSPGHAKPGAKTGGPPSKAKYERMTYSA